MCTVTYIPIGKNEFTLISNRDESPFRETLSPNTYLEDGVKLMYPKDKVAGGTWIGLSDKKRLVCLLNGGFTNHKKIGNYKMSRGVIVKELLKSENAVLLIEEFDFSNVEPFTIVLVEWRNELTAYELVWTGENRHFKKLGKDPKIWSSSTLYTNEMKSLREMWFNDWLSETNEITHDKIIKLHQDATKGNSEISFKMKREKVETVSVTSVVKKGENTIMSYLNVLENSIVSTS